MVMEAVVVVAMEDGPAEVPLVEDTEDGLREDLEEEAVGPRVDQEDTVDGPVEVAVDTEVVMEVDTEAEAVVL